MIHNSLAATLPFKLARVFSSLHAMSDLKICDRAKKIVMSKILHAYTHGEDVKLKKWDRLANYVSHLAPKCLNLSNGLFLGVKKLY